MSSWSDTVKKARKCRENVDLKKRVACLKRRLAREGDPWYLFELAVELEEQDRYREAYHYAEQAVHKLPKKEYRAQALAIAERSAKRIEVERAGGDRPESESASRKDSPTRDTLHIVICTRRKYWNDNSEPAYVPAMEAYTGDSMGAWKKSGVSKEADWLILSAKYGFIEPDHPIGYYDVAFSLPLSGPLPECALKEQVAFQERAFRDGRKPLKSFVSVYVHCRYRPDKCAEEYCSRVRSAYAPFGAEIRCDCAGGEI